MRTDLAQMSGVIHQLLSDGPLDGLDDSSQEAWVLLTLRPTAQAGRICSSLSVNGVPSQCYECSKVQHLGALLCCAGLHANDSSLMDTYDVDRCKLVGCSDCTEGSKDREVTASIE